MQCTLCFSVKFCAAWIKPLRAHFLHQTSDERFRTRRACRSVSSLGLSCAVRLSKAPGDPAARRGERPLPGAAAKAGGATRWPFICGASCVYLHRCRIYGPTDLCRQTDTDTHTQSATFTSYNICMDKTIFYLSFFSEVAEKTRCLCLFKHDLQCFTVPPTQMRVCILFV